MLEKRSSLKRFLLMPTSRIICSDTISDQIRSEPIYLLVCMCMLGSSTALVGFDTSDSLSALTAMDMLQKLDSSYSGTDYLMSTTSYSCV